MARDRSRNKSTTALYREHIRIIGYTAPQRTKLAIYTATPPPDHRLPERNVELPFLAWKILLPISLCNQATEVASRLADATSRAAEDAAVLFAESATSIFACVRRCLMENVSP